MNLTFFIDQINLLLDFLVYIYLYFYLSSFHTVWQAETLQQRMKSWKVTITLQAVVAGSVRVVRARVTQRAPEMAAITSQAKVPKAAEVAVIQKAPAGNTTRAAKVIETAAGLATYSMFIFFIFG